MMMMNQKWQLRLLYDLKDSLISFGDVLSYQKEIQVPGKPYGLKHDICCKTDFEFKDIIIDTKVYCLS